MTSSLKLAPDEDNHSIFFKTYDMGPDLHSCFAGVSWT